MCDVAVQEGLVRNLEQVRRNIDSKEEVVVDARGPGRFAGSEAEPRAGVRSGHIPNSVNVPFPLVNPAGKWEKVICNVMSCNIPIV